MSKRFAIHHRPAPAAPEFNTPEDQLRRRPRVRFWIDSHARIPRPSRLTSTPKNSPSCTAA
jgi:hypothetical protein